MNNRYNEAMKTIEVSDEMRDRVLNNISCLDFDKPLKRGDFFSNYKKQLSIAACFVVLILSSFIIHNAIRFFSEPPVQVIPDIVTYSSVKELSDTVGFTVKEIQALPFDVQFVEYICYWKELAEIKYTGSDNAVTLRMAVGNEDISGFYDEFKNIENYMVNGSDVTIKGNDGQFILAIWQNDGYTYSVQFTEPVSEPEILDVVQSIK